MARTVRQTLPKPPPIYDQGYIAQLADAVNEYMFQREALGEQISGRFVMTNPVSIPGDLPDTKTLATGTLYLTGTLQAADDTVLHQSWATATLTLTTTAQTIPGCTYTLARNGRFLLLANYQFQVIGAEQNAILYGGVTGSSHLAYVDTASKSGINSVGVQGIFQGTSGQVVSLTAYKSGGTGSSQTGMECGLTVVWVEGAQVARNFLTVVGTGDP
jgi:hypothetical protein